MFAVPRVESERLRALALEMRVYGVFSLTP